MSNVNTTSPSRTAPSRRTGIVWVSFLVAMVSASGLLLLKDTPVQGGVPLPTLAAVAPATLNGSSSDPIFDVSTSIDHGQWKGIVIHDLGEPAATMQSIHRRHVQSGYQGLGYHFVIGNGNGLGDGEVHLGYRWIRQLAGAHVVGDDGPFHNQHSIAICLVGDGDRRPFSPKQMKNLVRLVQRLQGRLDIPAQSVHLHRDLADGVASPGRHFQTEELRVGLIR